MKSTLKFNDFIELLYQCLSRYFNSSDFLKGIDYPIMRVADHKKVIDAIMTCNIFYIWIIMFSVKKNFGNLYKETLNSFLDLIWDRSQQIKDTYKNFGSFVLIINADFNKYDEALSDENDPIFKLCSSFLNYLFNREVTNIRALHYIVSHLHETSGAYDKIFKKIKLEMIR